VAPAEVATLALGNDCQLRGVTGFVGIGYVSAARISGAFLRPVLFPSTSHEQRAVLSCCLAGGFWTEPHPSIRGLSLFVRYSGCFPRWRSLIVPRPHQASMLSRTKSVSKHAGGQSQDSSASFDTRPLSVRPLLRMLSSVAKFDCPKATPGEHAEPRPEHSRRIGRSPYRSMRLGVHDSAAGNPLGMSPENLLSSKRSFRCVVSRSAGVAHDQSRPLPNLPRRSPPEAGHGQGPSSRNPAHVDFRECYTESVQPGGQGK